MEKARVNYEATRELGKQIKGEAEAYEQIYSTQIYTNFKEALQNAFQGDDATKAIEQLDALRNDFDAMKQVIWEYGNQLEKAANNYEEDMRASALKASKLTVNRK